MNRFRITAAALSLALTLFPVGAFADEPAAPPPPIPAKEATTTEAFLAPVAVIAPEEFSAPVLDLVFCIDISQSMQGYMSAVKATIPTLIRREKARYPGHIVRLGLVRYGDGNKRHFVLDLSEDQNRFLQSLQDTACNAPVPKVGGNVLDESAEEMDWSQHGVRRMYMIGNEGNMSGHRKGLVRWQEDIRVARQHKIIISTAFCPIQPFGDPRASDEHNVQSWLSSESVARYPWVEIAHYTGGEFIQIFSHKDGTMLMPQPLLGFVWQPTTALHFPTYLVRGNGLRGLTYDEYRNSKYGNRGWSNLPKFGADCALQQELSFSPREHFLGSEAIVIRYFETHPSKDTYLLRP